MPPLTMVLEAVPPASTTCEPLKIVAPLATPKSSCVPPPIRAPSSAPLAVTELDAAAEYRGGAGHPAGLDHEGHATADDAAAGRAEDFERGAAVQRHCAGTAAGVDDQMPPLSTVVPLATPPNSTTCVPPVNTVAPLARP